MANDSKVNKPEEKPDGTSNSTDVSVDITTTPPLQTNDVPLTEGERMYKQGLGNNSQTDKKPA